MKIKIFTILYFTFSLYLVGNAQSDNENSQDTTKTYLNSESGNSLNGHRLFQALKSNPRLLIHIFLPVWEQVKQVVWISRLLLMVKS